MVFEISGLIKDRSNREELEFWGHDAGEFVIREATDEKSTKVNENEVESGSKRPVEGQP